MKRHRPAGIPEATQFLKLFQGLLLQRLPSLMLVQNYAFSPFQPAVHLFDERIFRTLSTMCLNPRSSESIVRGLETPTLHSKA